MYASTRGRRAVLAGTGAAAALISVPYAYDTATGTLHAGTDGGARFSEITGVRASLCQGFGKAAEGASYPAVHRVGSTETITAVYRSDDEAKTWTRINDDKHQWGWIGAAVTGDPRIHGRVYVATGGRGVHYGESA